MKHQLSDNNILYLLTEFRKLDGRSAFHRTSVPLVSKRYLIKVFHKQSYMYRIQQINHICIRSSPKNEIQFGAEGEDLQQPIRHQKPLISLLKLITVTKEIEPEDGRNSYVVPVDGYPLKHARAIMKLLFENRIPAYYMSYFGDCLVTEEFNNLIASDTNYEPHIIYGTVKQLSSIGMVKDDPRIFKTVYICEHNTNEYSTPILNIKTKRLNMLLENLALSQQLPLMLHLTSLRCLVRPIFVQEMETDFYSNFFKALNSSAPSLKRIELSSQFRIRAESFEASKQAVVTLIEALEEVFSAVKKTLNVNIQHSIEGTLEMERSAQLSMEVSHLKPEEYRHDNGILHNRSQFAAFYNKIIAQEVYQNRSECCMVNHKIFLDFNFYRFRRDDDLSGFDRDSVYGDGFKLRWF
ncbi:unnamed protein product [Bursaphelenchus okinawaensis]|uniref:Uncharacterized protein n=1 Tax=Bursaphelenchus okinawaensis TaxID=465554 RepID=A0A811KCQ4_9BILA|nr:unnamed protein product [Bursaphelenchus okinawaensis]CAG9101121.1 unnamed protein product [Bursaphelenchus okinawaensis]